MGGVGRGRRTGGWVEVGGSVCKGLAPGVGVVSGGEAQSEVVKPGLVGSPWQALS